MIRFFLLSLIILNEGQASSFPSQFTKISTKFGGFLGTLEDEDGIKYIALRGIPYAESPIGGRRWQDPIMKRFPPNTILNATAYGPHCPQWIKKGNGSELIGEEDCLFANVFIPLQEKRRDLLKVMVFFHGGGFIVNSNRNMEPIPLLKEGVIVVMFNYRISIFGYLSTGRKDLPGNSGPLDQIVLLKWVREYAWDFGGDPDDITLFGSSIGAVSINYLLLTPLAKGLFHKAIMESGSALCERSLVPNPFDIALKLGKHFNCRYLVECLRSKSTRELMIAAKELTLEWVLPSVLGPVIDKSSRQSPFLPDYPERLPIINKVPVIAGITRDEGLTAFVKLTKGFTLQQLHNLDFIEGVILPKYLNLIMRARKTERIKYIDHLASEVMTFHGRQFKEKPIPTLIGILGDLWINTCHRKTLESLCRNNSQPVYAYLFTHHDPDSPSEIGQDISAFGQNGIVLDGPAHTEEILYMLQGESDKLEGRNGLMSKMLSSLWTDFAYGRKLFIKASTIQEWKPVCDRHQANARLPLQEISLDSQRLYPDFRLKQAEFWWRRHIDAISS